jgi:hypothetical protein
MDTDANIHVYDDIAMFFSYQVGGDYLLVDEERCPCSCSRSWYGHSEVHFGEDHIIEECVACTYHQEESSQRVSTV